MQWHTPIIPALRTLGLENQEFESTLCCNICWAGTKVPWAWAAPRGASAGLLGGWETSVGVRRTHMQCRESLGMEFTQWVMEGKGKWGRSEAGRRQRGSSHLFRRGKEREKGQAGGGRRSACLGGSVTCDGGGLRVGGAPLLKRQGTQVTDQDNRS